MTSPSGLDPLARKTTDGRGFPRPFFIYGSPDVLRALHSLRNTHPQFRRTSHAMTTPTPFVRKDDLSTSPEKRPSGVDLGGVARRALLPLLILLAWYLAAEARLFPPLLLPSPGRVFGAAAELLETGELAKHAAASLARVVSGFLISSAAALLLAFLFYRRRRWEEGASIVLESLRVVPPLSLVPLLILWLGIGEAAKLAIVVLSSFFPVYLNALSSLRAVEARWREYARAFELTPGECLRHIHVPGALGGLLTGLRLGFGYAWRALIGSELIAAASGLGYLIEDASSMARTDVVFVGVLTIALLGILCDVLFQKGAEYFEARMRRKKSLTLPVTPPTPQNASQAAASAAPKASEHDLPAVRIEMLGKTFPGGTAPFEALTDTFPAGRVTALLGRSGCGKTTLLKIVAGLSAPTAGSVRFERKAGSGAAALRPAIGIVFQSPMLLDWKTVVENVEMGILHVPETERRERALAALDVVGLGDRADACPEELSGGMAQRVGFARALARNPEVLLMDEPFGALDALTRTALQRRCRTILAERPMTVLLITHDVREAVRLGDEIRILEGGRLVTEPAVADPAQREAGLEAAALEERILTRLLGRASLQ